MITGAPAEPTATPNAVATPVPSPVMLPIAGAHVEADAAVIRPLAFTVNAGHDVDDPNEPTLPFTVARVVANAPADVVMSPVRAGN